MNTNEWPQGITNNADISTAPATISDPEFCDPTISEIAAEIKPRCEHLKLKHSRSI